MLRRLTVFRCVRGLAVAALAVLAGGAVECHRAYGTDPITATLKANQGVGIGFDLLADNAKTGTVKLTPPAGWGIASSTVQDKSGTTFWERSSADQNEHQWVGYGFCVGPNHKKNAHNFVYSRTYVRFGGQLCPPQAGGGGSLPSFTASVADLDIGLTGVHDVGEADEPNGGLRCSILYSQDTFPVTAPSNCVPLTVQLNLTWPGAPPTSAVFGTLTLAPNNGDASGVKLYRPDGQPLTGNVTITSSMLTGSTYTATYHVLTNNAFTSPAIVEATFTWDAALAGGPPTAKDKVRLRQ